MEAAETQTRFAIPIFTSFLSWYAHFPIFLVSPPEKKTTPVQPHGDPYGPVTPHIYTSYYTVQLFLAHVRQFLNLAGTVLVYIGYRYATVVPAASATDYYIDLCKELLKSPMAVAGGWLFFVSTVLWVITYVSFRFHLIRLAIHNPESPSLKVPRITYTIVGMEPFNWLFDIPGMHVNVARVPRLIILLITLICGSIYTVAILLQEPCTLCWGCYKRGTSILGLVAGVCASCPLLTPQDQIPPVCNQPEVSECGAGKLRWSDMWAHERYIAGSFLFASFMLMLFVARPKRLEYYETLRVEALSMKK